MRHIIPNLLWTGNAHDLKDVGAVLSHGVKAVVDLAANEPSVLYPRDIAYCRLPLNDGAENDPAILRLAVHSTVEFIKARVPILVGCSAGMSRSPAVAAAALALIERRSPDDALREITSTGPHDVAPALWADIKRIVLTLDAGSNATSAGVSLALVVLKSQQIEILRSFYEALGVELVEERHGKGSQHFAGRLDATVFEIYPASAGEQVDVGIRLRLNVAHLAKLFKRLRSNGTPIVSEPKATEWGTRAVIRDPDGRAVELYQR
jgi:predicted enzyme related to lactoylglutathione lyase